MIETMVSDMNVPSPCFHIMRVSMRYSLAELMAPITMCLQECRHRNATLPKLALDSNHAASTIKYSVKFTADDRRVRKCYLQHHSILISFPVILVVNLFGICIAALRDNHDDFKIYCNDAFVNSGCFNKYTST